MKEAYGVGWRTSDFLEASPVELFLACEAWSENEFRYYDFLARLATGKGLKKKASISAPQNGRAQMNSFLNGLKSIYGNDR